MSSKCVRFFSLAVLLVGIVLATGCMRNKYVVPIALTEEYATQAPLTVGVLIRPDMRQQWFQWQSDNLRQRIDVPVGKLTLDFARAGLHTAFEDFYLERFYDRRSQKGLLAIVDHVDYALDGYHVVLSMAVRIEDESQTVVLDKTYHARGSRAGRPIVGIPFISKKPQKVFEINTRAAYQQVFREMVADILTLVGLAGPAAPPEAPPLEDASLNPVGEEADAADDEPENDSELAKSEKPSTRSRFLTPWRQAESP